MKKIFKTLLLPVIALGFLTACEDVPAPYYLLTRQSEGVIFEEKFTNSLGKWVVYNETTDGYEWTNNYSSAYISGYQNNVNKATKSWLISPAFDLTDVEQAYVTFDYVYRFKRSTTKEQLLVSADYDGDPLNCTWELVDITLKEGSDYTTFFTTGGNLPPDIMGQQKVHIALYYEATDKEASTWEVKNLSVRVGSYESEKPVEVDAIFFSTLINDKADFTPQTITAQDGSEFEVWKNGTYGWIATGYDADASADGTRVYHAGEAWLISPDIKLPEGDSYLQFMHALNYRNSEGLGVYIAEVDATDATGRPNWQVLDVAWPAGTNWTYITSGDILLSEFAGKTIKIGFKYTGFNDGCATWEIKNFGIYEGKGNEGPILDTEGSGTAENPYTVADALYIIREGQAPASEVYVKGKISQLGDARGNDLPGNSYGNATYFISDVDETGGFKGEPLEVFRGLGLGGERISKSDYITVGDEVIVCGILTLYNTTPEFTQGSKMYMLNGKYDNGGDEGNFGEPKGSGTMDDPYNVAATVKLIDGLGSATSDYIYTKGIITSLGDPAGKDMPGNSYGNATYFISDMDASGTPTGGSLEVFRGYGLGGEKMTADYIKVGDVVVVYGKVKLYNGKTREFDQGSMLYSLNGETAPEVPEAEPKGSGTLEDPYNAAKANEVAGALASGATTDIVYIKGKVSDIKENYDTKNASTGQYYGNATFWISDDGTATSQFYIFRALYLGNKDYNGTGTLLKKGDDVVICGKLTKYGTTPETSQKEAYLYSLNGDTGGGDTPQPASGGTYDEPFTVEQANNAWVDGKQLKSYVTGYIVGYVTGSKYEEGALFGSDALAKAAAASSVTNMLISYTPQASTVEQCIPVQLPAGDIRSGLNLKDHPELLGTKVLIYGSIETFFKVAGLRTPSYAEYEIADPTGAPSTTTIGTRPDAAKKRYANKFRK